MKQNGGQSVNFQSGVARPEWVGQTRIYAACLVKNNYSDVEAFCAELCYKFAWLVRMILNR
jgi:hypothetical protein